MAVMSVGGSPTNKFSTPNNQTTPLDVTGLLFNSANETKIKVSIVSSIVTSLSAVVSDYNLVVFFINGVWGISPGGYSSDLGGYDNITWSVTAAGQVQMVTTNLPGVYDPTQSGIAYTILVRA